MSTPHTIATLREAIDEADEILLRALGARLRAVRLLKNVKSDTGMRVESASREAELKAQWKKRAKELKIPEELALLILDFLLTESKRIQSE